MKTRTHSFALIGLCLLALYIMPIPIIFAADGLGSSTIPGVPDDAVDYDRTAMTPDSKMEQITAGNLHVYRYQHVTMLMNCSQNMIMNMTSDNQVRNRIVGLDIEADQPFQLNVYMMTEPPAGVQTMQRTLNTYWGLEPNATLQLRIQLRVHINESALNGELNRQINAEQLRWMYWNQDQNRWETVDSSIDADGYLVCETDHFSTWTVAEIDTPTPWLTYALIGGVIVAVAIVVIYLLKRW